MIIRDFTQADKTDVLEMVEVFYHSPGVLHHIPTQNFANAYDEMCDGGSQRLRGLLIEESPEPGAAPITSGFCSLSFSYSTEAGGPVVLIEEVYIKPEFRGFGLGQAVFAYLKESYRSKAARLRLEVAQDNTRAIALYQRLGFTELPYMQMTMEDF